MTVVDPPNLAPGWASWIQARSDVNAYVRWLWVVIPPDGFVPLDVAWWFEVVS